MFEQENDFLGGVHPMSASSEDSYNCDCDSIIWGDDPA